MGRPWTWKEVRRRVLEEDLYDMSELESRRDKAQQLRKYSLWVIPLFVLLIPQIIFDGATLLLVAGIGMVAYGAGSMYVMGRIFERRWDELIREKAALQR
jgi:hypothetical protein